MKSRDFRLLANTKSRDGSRGPVPDCLIRWSRMPPSRFLSLILSYVRYLLKDLICASTLLETCSKTESWRESKMLKHAETSQHHLHELKVNK